MKGIFDTKQDSGYDDNLAERYHFPTRSNYMDVALAVQGDWILYREPQRNGGRRAYIGTARVVSVVPDENQPGHAYAYVENFIQFDPPVPFSGGPLGYWETPLRGVSKPSLVGQALQGKAMRLVAEADFAAIVTAGLGETLSPEGLLRYSQSPSDIPALQLGLADLPDESFERRVELALINRKVRDANFRKLVCRAYDDTCAVTGLRIINGGGRSEVQAAHIWPVEHGGPDVIQNGIALSGTVHWLFDRHLISINEDYQLHVAHNRVPTELIGLFEKQMERVRLPSNPMNWPHPKYIARRREHYGV